VLFRSPLGGWLSRSLNRKSMKDMKKVNFN